MANHKSSKKRIRQSEKKRVHNKYYTKTTRTFIKRLKETTDKAEAEKMLPYVTGMIDKLPNKENVEMIRKPVNMENLIDLIKNKLNIS